MRKEVLPEVDMEVAAAFGSSEPDLVVWLGERIAWILLAFASGDGHLDDGFVSTWENQTAFGRTTASRA